MDSLTMMFGLGVVDPSVPLLAMVIYQALLPLSTPGGGPTSGLVARVAIHQSSSCPRLQPHGNKTGIKILDIGHRPPRNTDVETSSGGSKVPDSFVARCGSRQRSDRPWKIRILMLLEVSLKVHTV